MLPVKWIKFRVITFLQLFFSVPVFALTGKAILGSFFAFPYALLFIPAIAVPCNCYCHLPILRRHFPDQIPSRSLPLFSKIIFALNMAAALLLHAIIYIDAESAFGNDFGSSDPNGKNSTGRTVFGMYHAMEFTLFFKKQ
jgi:hypothetical protein